MNAYGDVIFDITIVIQAFYHSAIYIQYSSYTHVYFIIFVNNAVLLRRSSSPDYTANHCFNYST